MRLSLFILFFLFAFQIFAAETVPWLLMPETHAKKNMKVCYRWMSEREMNAWLNEKAPQAYRILEQGKDHLDRDGKTTSGIYCWHHPTGAMRGGPGEFYGEFVARIEFVDDVVLYDRNDRTYSSGNGSEVPENLKLEIDSEIFYANYKTKDQRMPWFQEYIIRNPQAIKSFSFDSFTLRQEVREGIKEVITGTLSWENTHMYGTQHCPFLTSEEDSSWWTFQTNPKRYYCQDTRAHANQVLKNLEMYWSDSIETIILNKDVRQPL